MAKLNKLDITPVAVHLSLNTKWPRFYRLLSIILLLFSSAAPVLKAQTDPQSMWRFGVINASEAPQDVAALGVGWEQIAVEWAAIQPSGPADFVAQYINHQQLTAAVDVGRDVVGVITHTPAWASVTGDPAAVPDGLSLPVDAVHNYWAAFMRQLVTYYAPLGVHHWVIYDAPDVPRGEGPVRFAGTVAGYAQLLKVAYSVATTADPQAVIHLAGMYWWGDVAAGREPYLTRLLRILATDSQAAQHGYYFDVVTLRVFDQTQAVWDVLVATRAILVQTGLSHKPIWLETNAGPTLDSQESVSGLLFGIDPDQQADFIVQVAAICLAAGVERIGINRLTDHPGEDQPWGLVRTDGTHRVAFDAYRIGIELFAPTIAARRYVHVAADLIVLEQGDRDIYVMWSRDTIPVQFLITSGRAGETAAVYNTYRYAGMVTSELFEWPAMFTVDTPAARRDANGFLTVAGAPRMLILGRDDDFFRVVYAIVNGERYRLK